MIEKIRGDLYIKKGWDGYRVVYPIKKELDKPFSRKNAHWKNILIGGHWSRPLKLLLFLIALYLFTQMYLADTKLCRDFVQQITSGDIKIIGNNNLINNNPQEITPLDISNIQFFNNKTIIEDLLNES